MRVMITGSSTPLGRALTERLLSRSDISRVLLVCERDAPQPATDSRATVVVCDLRRERDLRSLLFGPAVELGITAVVDGARHRSVDAAGPRVRALNVEATRELLHLCERHPTVSRYVLLSSAAVYRADPRTPDVVDEESALDFRAQSPQWRRDRVEADTCACVRMGMSPLRITVLRMAELFAEGCGSQLWDYLQTPVCLRPLGYDPMIELLSLEDAARAVELALRAETFGVFNVPGRDVLPLSALIAASGRQEIAVPGPLLAPLYALRRTVTKLAFRYDVNRDRLHQSCVLDGRRAREHLGYEPSVGAALRPAAR